MTLRASAPPPAGTGHGVRAEKTFERLAELAREKTFLLSDIWQRSRLQFGPAWVEEVVDNVVRIFGTEEQGWEAAIRGYAEFCRDSMSHQEFFEANGRYRRSRLKEIQGPFYENEAHMMQHYLPGMLLSHYLWPHHFKLLTFFRQEALTLRVPSARDGARSETWHRIWRYSSQSLARPLRLRGTQCPKLFYDVGIGTGLYSREVLRAFPGIRGRGFDISPHSAAFTRRLLQAYGLAERYEVTLGDVLTGQPPREQADFLVSQEVLEHLEEPVRFIALLRRMVRPGGTAYITAAINAGLSDHITLFRSPGEVQGMLTGAGWKIRKWRAEYAYPDAPVEVTPCVAAFVCEA